MDAPASLLCAPLAFLGFGFQEILLVAFVALLVFGGNLPDVMRQLGRTYGKFRQSLNELSQPVRDEMRQVRRVSPPDRSPTRYGEEGSDSDPSPDDSAPDNLSPDNLSPELNDGSESPPEDVVAEAGEDVVEEAGVEEDLVEGGIPRGAIAPRETEVAPDDEEDEDDEPPPV